MDASHRPTVSSRAHCGNSRANDVGRAQCCLTFVQRLRLQSITVARDWRQAPEGIGASGVNRCRRLGPTKRGACRALSAAALATFVGCGADQQDAGAPLAAGSGSHSLTVVVSGVRDANGSLRAVLCSEQESFPMTARSAPRNPQRVVRYIHIYCGTHRKLRICCVS